MTSNIWIVEYNVTIYFILIPHKFIVDDLDCIIALWNKNSLVLFTPHWLNKQYIFRWKDKMNVFAKRCFVSSSLIYSFISQGRFATRKMMQNKCEQSTPELSSSENIKLIKSDWWYWILIYTGWITENHLLIRKKLSLRNI